MRKYLFLDDERTPKGVKWINLPKGGPWNIVRSYDEAVAWVMKHGFPDVISFDHDLGEGKNGYDFAKWLVDYDIDTESMPDDFIFTVHSMNPIGAKNIQTYLDNYLRIKRMP